MARRQAPEIAAPEPLRVPAPVTDLFAAPAPPPIDNNTKNLASALESFAPALARFSRVMNKPDGTEQAQAQKFIAGHTNEEYKAAVENGSIPNYADPVANGVIQKNYGMVLGKSISDSIDADIKAGKIDLTDPNTNIDAVLTQRTKDALSVLNQHYPNSKFAAAGLTGTIGTARQSLIAQQHEARVQQSNKDRLGVVQQQFGGMIQQAGKEGLQPDGTVSDAAATKAFDNIRTAYGELGKSLGLPPQWMDQQLITELSNNASTNPEVVWKVLTSPRTDEKGNPLPSLASNPRYALQVQQITQAVNTAMGKKYDTMQERHLVQNGVQALTRQDGSIWGLHDLAYKNKYTGEDKIITADSVKKKVMAGYQSWSDQTAQQRGENSDVQFERDANVYLSANAVNPTWKAALEGAATTLSNPAALQNPDTRQKAIQAGELFMKLSARNYTYLNDTMNLDKKSRAFYDTYEVARRYMGQNADTALDTASSVVNTPENASDMNVRASQKQEIDNQVSSNFGSWWPWADKPDNLGVVKKRVGDVASVLVRIHGMDPKAAVDAAAKLIHDRSTTINGHIVTDQGYMPPKDLQTYIPKALDQFAKDQGAYNGITSSSDLSIQPAGHTGNFRIVAHDDSGVPRPLFVLKDGHAVPAIITMSDLHNLQLMDRQHHDESIIKQQQSNASGNFSPSFIAPSREDFRKQSEATRAAIGKAASAVGSLFGGNEKPGQFDTRGNYTSNEPDPLVHALGVLPGKVKSLWGWASGKVREHYTPTQPFTPGKLKNNPGNLNDLFNK